MKQRKIDRIDVDSRPRGFSRQMEAPEPSITSTFYPLGFPVVLRTNSLVVMEMAEELWGFFDEQYVTIPIRADVHLIESDAEEYPPRIKPQIMLPLMMSIADSNNYSVLDLKQLTVQTLISTAVLRDRAHAKLSFLGAPVLAHISTRFTTPLHAACISLDGQGLLLCGDSGAGKSSLAFACARTGWTYVADDGSYLLNSCEQRRVVGNCHQLRLDYAACDLFPELKQLKMTSSAAGKPWVDLQTAKMPSIVRSQTATVKSTVFLNRHSGGPPMLISYSKDAARESMRQIIYGLPETQLMQLAAIDQLLEADVYELRYDDLNWAADRLKRLIREGA